MRPQRRAKSYSGLVPLITEDSAHKLFSIRNRIIDGDAVEEALQDPDDFWDDDDREEAFADAPKIARFVDAHDVKVIVFDLFGTIVVRGAEIIAWSRCPLTNYP